MAALVKFLGGPQAGAEVALPPGEYALGCDDAADIVLVDAAVKPRHAVLTIGAEAWEIEPLDEAEVRLDGGRVAAKTQVVPYQVLSFGGTHLALGPDGPWRALPAIPTPVPEKNDDPGGNSPGAHAPAEEKKESAKRDGATFGAKPEGKDRAAHEAGSEVAAVGRRKNRSRLWMVVVLAIAAAVAFAYWRVTLPEDPGRQRAEKARERLLAAGFSLAEEEGDPPLPGILRIEPDDSGAILLTGLMATEMTRRRALDAAGLPESELRDGMTTMEAQLLSVSRELRRTGPGLTVSPLGEGFVAVLSGVVDSASEMEAAYRLLRERLDAGIGIRRRVWQWRDLAREAELEAERLGIRGARFLRDGGRVRFMVDPPASPESRRELAALLRERLGEQAGSFLVPALEDFPPEEPAEEAPPPRPAPEPEPAPEEPPESEAEDAPPEAKFGSLREFWRVSAVERDGFIDHSGRKWLIGDVLGNGLRLVGVWKGGVVLQRGTETLFVQRDAMVFDGGAEPRQTE